MYFIDSFSLLNFLQCDIKDKTACDNGCGGGLMTNAYKYLLEAGGLEEESSYPYTGKRGQCKFKLENVAVRVVNFTNIPNDENQIAAYLVNYGPLAGNLLNKRISICAHFMLYFLKFEWSICAT